MKLKIDNFHEKAAWGSISQALQSIINFGTSIFLIKYSTLEQFGIYGILFGICIFFVGVSNALVSTQLTVNSAGMEKENRNKQTAEMFIYLSLLSILICSLCSLTYALIYKEYFQQHIWLALILGIYGFIINEFTRRYFYLSNNLKSACYLDGVIIISVATGLYFSLESNHTNIHTDALAYRGFFSAFFSILIIYLYRLPIIKATKTFAQQINNTIKNGFWALGGSVITNLQNQSIIYLVGSQLGTAAVGEMNAARLLIAPLTLLSNGLSRVFLPNIAEQINQNNFNRAKLFAKKVLYALLIIAALYSITVYLLSGRISKVILSEEYTQVTILTFLWILYFISTSIRNYPSIILQANKSFRELTTKITIASIAGLALVSIGVIYFEIAGGIISLVLADLLLFYLLMTSKIFSK